VIRFFEIHSYPPSFDRVLRLTMAMAAPAAEPIGTPIESFFRPSTRFRDSVRELLDDGDEWDGLPEEFTEMELLPHLTLQDILATGTTCEDLACDFLGDDQIVWTAPDVYVSPGYLP
jgi:hypothetical protein